MGRRLVPIALALVILAVLPGAAFGLCTEVAYHVNTTADETTPSDGLVSLREAVAAANADPTPNACHEIFLPPGHYTLLPAQGGTLQLTAAPIVVIAPEAPIISSHEVVIDGGDAVSLFHVAPGIDAQFNSLTLTHGLRAIVNDGQATLSRLTVVDNHVTGASGGAVLNNVGQQMYVYDSTFVGNRVSGSNVSGGAFENQGGLDFTTTTLVDNSASGTTARGGAIHNNGTLTVAHSTLDRNVVNTLSVNGGGPDVFNESGKTAVTQDAIYGSGCNAQLTPVGAEGLSVGSDTTCVANAGDLKLGPLQDNGGPTDTEMLLPGSVAIDTYTLQCGPDRDQRGVTRPQGAKCDSGAYELVQSGGVGITADVSSVAIAQGATVTLPFHVAVGAQGDDSLANDLVSPTVTTVLPDGLAFVSGAPGCAAAGQTVTCTLGATANGATVPVTIDVRADAAGVFQDTSSVSAPRPDTSSGDDQASITITSTAPPPPPAQAKVGFASKPKVNGDRVRFTLACSGAACAGDARILVKERLRRHHVIAILARTVALGKKSFSIAAGGRATLTLRLSKAGRNLRKRYRLPARLNIRLGTPKTTAASAAIVFKRHR